MSRTEHFRKLERMYLSAPTNEYYMPKIRIDQGRAEIEIPIEPKHFHAGGAVHGSVYFKALDDSAFFAANSFVEDVFVLTVSFNVHFTRPVSEGVIKATGRIVHRSRRLMVAESRLLNGLKQEIARGTGTFMRSRIPLTPDIGYR
ncbi:MAG: PaaI family thioesterase [Acidobacteriota bacterium]|nr:MAG: PaaI family thioesterase [Acidobacteriota bacterium]